jgi:hypothetical protein
VARVDFLIADTFTDSLALLTADEQKAVKTAAFDLPATAARIGRRDHALASETSAQFCDGVLVHCATTPS